MHIGRLFAVPVCVACSVVVGVGGITAENNDNTQPRTLLHKYAQTCTNETPHRIYTHPHGHENTNTLTVLEGGEGGGSTVV